MSDENTEGSQMYEGAKELIKSLASESRLSPILSTLKKLFPTRATEITNRFRNVVRTPELDCAIVDSYLAYSGNLYEPFRRRLNACLVSLVEEYTSTYLELNPIHLGWFLIERGADVDVQDNVGRTLLQFLIGGEWSDWHRRSCLKIIKDVLSKGADPLMTDRTGRNAVELACLKNRDDIIHLIYEASPPDRAAKVIESLELYGSLRILDFRYAKTSLYYSIGSGMGAWLLAIRLKQPNENNSISDEEFRQMFSSIDSALLYALNSLEKILGAEHKKAFLCRMECAWRQAEMRQYCKLLCILKECFVQIFSFTLSASARNERLNHLTCVFRKMFDCETVSDDIRGELCFADIAEYLQVVIETVIDIRQNQKQEPLSREENGHILSLISYIVILFCFLNCRTPEKIHFKRLVRKAISLDLVSIHGEALLLETATTIEDRIRNSDRYMHILCAVKLLLECGVNANERNIFGNTLLHHFALNLRSNRLLKDQPSSGEIDVAKVLVEYGLHADATNCNGFQVSDILLQRYGIAISGVRDLRCLAARVIRSKNIPYVGIIPKDLYDFVELHGSSSMPRHLFKLRK